MLSMLAKTLAELENSQRKKLNTEHQDLKTFLEDNGENTILKIHLLEFLKRFLTFQNRLKKFGNSQNCVLLDTSI